MRSNGSAAWNNRLSGPLCLQRDKLNRIAGAPDYEGGIGMGCELYGFTEDMSEFMCFRSVWGSIGFYTEKGEKTNGFIAIEPW